MADSNQTPSQDAISRYLAPGGDNVKLIYVLYLASALIGITVLVGLIMAYMNRGQVVGTWSESHYTYQIRTFWIGLLYSFISVVLMLVGIGFLLILAVVIWAIVRCIKGLQWAAVGNPVPNPESWIV
jgi:uncharacterized membrane protein